jgi:hypothetical protein
MKLVSVLFFILLFNCASPEKILKKYGNDYSYSQISGAHIYYCKPIIANAVASFNDNTKFFHPTETQTDESMDIEKTFFEFLKSEIKVKGFPWQGLSDTATRSFALVNGTDSAGAVAVKPESYPPLVDLGVDYLIVIYDICYAHKQSTSIQNIGTPGIPGMKIGNPGLPGMMAAEQSSNRLDFSYRCAIFDIKNRKAIMSVAMHESSSNSLNFYEKVCDKLFSVIMYTRK